MPKVRIHTPFPQLRHQQADASRPRSADVWLSASAGTGKTQVLVARVLRLLLHGARPESILCLTFTKAGAAEMAIRVNEVLAAWVTLPRGVLGRDLINLGEDHGDDAIDRARTLFARVLDARGGGLRIQTIHSFCQSLLGSFPGEAGLTPGFRPIEGREEAALAASALADMVADAERGGDLGLIDRLKALSLRMGENAARAQLKRCAGAPRAMEALGAAQGIEPKVRRWLAGQDDIEGKVTALCADDACPRILLDQFREMNCGWVKKSGEQRSDGAKAQAMIDDWLAGSPAHRYATIDTLVRAWRKADGKLRTALPDHSECADVVDALDTWLARLLELKRTATIAPHIADALIVGQAYSRAYADAKRRAGAVDFNDLIERTVALLQTPGIGDWIAYKLDQRTDHILVDEAQDTNAAQWSIVRALTQEFFAGFGQKGDRVRTLFTVGDYKQAIFGFQGTDPREFERAQDWFIERAREAEREPLELSLSQSFRSSQPILDVVDATVATIGAERFGRIRAENHRSAEGGWGSVTLWPPVALTERDEDEDADEQSFTTSSERVFASDLAGRIKSWTAGGLTLRNRGERTVRPGDIMILVRSRGELARLIVSRLYEEGVEVAGVDRLRLNAPIAVQDLLAAMRFVLQPEDDLTLAALLVSPLIGWTQEQLYEHSHVKRRASLWQQLGDAKPEALQQLLAIADFETPYRFLETMLSGPMAGRRRLIARLGEEARDPIEELVNAALAYEREAAPSLQHFVDWFDRGDVEIKRDPGQGGDAVRVMTVHGAKGLQAPVVILADASADPDFKHPSSMIWQADEETRLPLFRPRKEELCGSLQESARSSDEREREEHWRLLYVAMTRAEEHLFIGGALRPRQAKGMGGDCWHMQIGAAMRGMGAVSDDLGALCVTGGVPKPVRKQTAAQPLTEITPPAWLDRAAPAEARPPRPLAPSAIKPDDRVSDPPPTATLKESAARGVLLHGLFERLPAVTPGRRRAAGLIWLEQARGVADVTGREELVDAALAVIDDPGLAQVFSGEALTEAPLAGVVGGQVIAGTVDRLLISADRVTVIDYKTGRRVPQDAESVPPHHVAQMAAYAAVLEAIFPDRPVEAALLYSHEARLIALPPAMLARYKPDLSA